MRSQSAATHIAAVVREYVGLLDQPAEPRADTVARIVACGTAAMQDLNGVADLPELLVAEPLADAWESLRSATMLALSVQHPPPQAGDQARALEVLAAAVVGRSDADTVDAARSQLQDTTLAGELEAEQAGRWPMHDLYRAVDRAGTELVRWYSRSSLQGHPDSLHGTP